MTKTESHATVRIVLQDGEPYIESRLRAVDDAEDGPIPKGKILFLRMPLLTPGTSEAETESELIDDDGSDEAFCPDCAAAGHDPEEMVQLMRLGDPVWWQTEERSKRSLSVRQRKEVQALLPQLTTFSRRWERCLRSLISPIHSKKVGLPESTQ